MADHAFDQQRQLGELFCDTLLSTTKPKGGARPRSRSRKKRNTCAQPGHCSPSKVSSGSHDGCRVASHLAYTLGLDTLLLLKLHHSRVSSANSLTTIGSVPLELLRLVRWHLSYRNMVCISFMQPKKRHPAPQRKFKNPGSRFGFCLAC